MLAERIERLAEADEIAGDQLCALVNELVEGMLPVGAGLAPDDRPRLIVDGSALQVDMLAVAFHIELLQIGAQVLEILIVRQDRHRLGSEEVIIPESDQAQQDRQVLLKGGCAEVLIHSMEAAEHLAE